MVKKRHDAIPEILYQAPAGTSPGVEVMSLSELRRRAPEGEFDAPQRPRFHSLFAIESGTASHTVDFTGYTLKPGSVLWVRPGQVQQFGDLTAIEGTLVLFQPGFLAPETARAARLDDRFGGTWWQPVGEDREAVRAALRHLEYVFRSGRGLPAEVHTAMLRHLLAVLVLCVAHQRAPAGSPLPEPSETYLRFRDAVERDFARTHRVADYAEALGYSPRTLSRATLAAAGVGAKEFLDRRVVLEARRLLAHSELSVSRVAAQTGFTDAANFSKFFQHRTGQAPGAFRDAMRGGRGAPRDGRPDGAAASREHLPNQDISD
ncbi:AraC family transcriptional regulator [Streptomyces sp. XD-27]|uniref:AraC family transcriptional regulator n=1 Tax=Streptomyces sp. XD-27 TaxID=3062779 RepID=UPI0026F41B51|nr:AraC family transcriptional regulator [Streptomyces sp. XD-27]WKX68819.1 AraC family transcriptional regulator [Streptomyces sp. XD-27]